MLGNQLQKLQDTTQMLRKGQIIQGRILKLYPNNKASIQLGTNKLIAQLEASLAVGERYHFQVGSTENMIHLKVLGDALTYNSKSHLQELFSHLGIKSTKVNHVFVNTLLERKIPFNKGQLQRAIALLEGTPDKRQAQNVLLEMIAKRIPLTDSIFEALQERLVSSFTERLGALDKAVQNTPTLKDNHKQVIYDKFNSVISQDKLLSKLLVIAENKELFHLLKSIQIIDHDSQFTEWSNRVKNISNGNVLEVNTLVDVDKLQNLFKIDSIRNNVLSILNIYGDNLQSSIGNKKPLAVEVFANLVKEVKQNVLQPLQINSAHLVNNPQQLQNLLQELEVLAHSDKLLSLDRFSHQLIKDSFAEQTRNMLENVGLQYEKSILHDEKNPANSLKAILLSLVQTSDGLVQDQANKFLQFVNGMQLQSIQETGEFLQANLIVPASKLGIESDVELDFEGKKKDNGEIDPDFCRVVFYLDLATIKKTVVDMHVQKRSISLTILNDNSIEDIMRPLQSLLKEGLENINYHLSNVSHKPLSSRELNHTKNKFLKYNQYSSSKGVDLRI